MPDQRTLPARTGLMALTTLAALTAPPAMPQGNWTHVVVDSTSPRDPHCKAAGDLNRDGKMDLLVASDAGEGVFWYEQGPEGSQGPKGSPEESPSSREVTWSVVFP